MDFGQTSATDQDDVRVQKLSHGIADRLRAQIVTGQLKPGDKLPLESDLLERFKVSRPTIREALRILEVEALISLGRGARTGATVLGPTVERAAEYSAMVLASGGTTMGELHEVRAILEPTMVLRVGKKKDKKLFDELEMHVVAGHAAVEAGNFQLALTHINEYRTVLLRATENRALTFIMDMLRVLSEKSVDTLLESGEDARNMMRTNMIKALQAHQQLVDLLRNGQSEEAQAFWRKYMERSVANLTKSGFGAQKLQHR
ncbi:FadR/GntR family transcriptional regulator [Paraburkholderia phytofirmans]|uniref:FadR/GntR family transcriptional regulator n=1 Tax=Paraburkholderia phytofirmans TaxID=261302 RepID=UPI0038B74B0C